MIKTLSRFACSLLLLSLAACAAPRGELTIAAIEAEARAQAQSFSRLSVDGTRIADESGETIDLRGANLGNWFLLEMWMLSRSHAGIPDQYTFEKTLEQRFGIPEKNRLMDLYRRHWITERDYKLIPTFGLNTVRIPFHYSILQRPAEPFTIRENGWQWLDYAIALAEKHGLYVILDLHGAPGAQSGDHVTGRQNYNRLWTDETFQDQTVWLWEQIADRYKDRKCIAAYDLLNEPWGGERQQLADLIQRIYDAVRAIDSETIVIFPGFYDGIDFYGHPDEHGWDNMMFTMHFYPGFFGNGRNNWMTHSRFLNEGIPEWEEKMEGLGVPLFIGEFQVQSKRAGGGEMMRRYFDAYNSRGWPATLWSYKVLSRDGGIGGGIWGMVTNADPYEPLDLERAPLQAIEERFRSFSQMPYEIDEDLRFWLTTDESPDELPYPPPTPPRMTEPAGIDPLPWVWSVDDIGGALPGGQVVQSRERMDIYGGGDDIWSTEDQFRFVWTKVAGDFTLTASVLELTDTHEYAKAALMVRNSLAPEAPAMLINVFPDGGIERAWRSEAGQPMESQGGGQGQLPGVRLQLERSGDVVTASFASGGGEWSDGLSVEMPGIGTICYVGLAVLSHDNSQLTKAAFDEIELQGQVVVPGMDGDGPGMN